MNFHFSITLNNQGSINWLSLPIWLTKMLTALCFSLEVNLKLNDSKEYTAVIQQNKPFGQQVYHANKSDMAEE